MHKALPPIFRDSEDFPAGHPPSEQTLAALEASRFLIVICLPNAAKSKYVNEEIRRFKILRGANSIIPVIVGGQPGELERDVPSTGHALQNRGGRCAYRGARGGADCH